MNVLQTKAAVRARDGFRCTGCGMTNDEHKARYKGKSLHVHRSSPGSEYTVDGCVSLCYVCHGPKPRSKVGGALEPFQFRPWNAGLVAALDAASKDENGPYYRRPRNTIINLMVEEELRALGKLPPG